MNMELSILFFLCLPVSKHPTQIDMRFPSVFLVSMISVSIILFWHVVFFFCFERCSKNKGYYQYFRLKRFSLT